MERSLQSYHRLGLALLAATTISSLSIKAADAQSEQPGSASMAQEEPIKRTVLFRGNLEGVEGKRSSSSSRNLRREQWAQSIIILAPNFFMCSKAHWPTNPKVVQPT